MGYGHGDSFPFDFEPNGIPFGSKSKGKLSLRLYPIQCEWKYSFQSEPKLFQFFNRRTLVYESLNKSNASLVTRHRRILFLATFQN